MADASSTSLSALIVRWNRGLSWRRDISVGLRGADSVTRKLYHSAHRRGSLLSYLPEIDSVWLIVTDCIWSSGRRYVRTILMTIIHGFRRIAILVDSVDDHRSRRRARLCQFDSGDVQRRDRQHVLDLHDVDPC